MYQYLLFETLAIIDGKIQNSFYHQQRMDNSFINYFKLNPKWDLLKIIDIPSEFRTGLVRCRIDYNQASYKINFYPYSPRQINTFQCVYIEDLDYRFKYCDRSKLEQLKTTNKDEVIIINNGFVSDCSIGNLLFLKQKIWYSPQHYLLKGTQLTRLVEEKKVYLAEIRAENLFDYEQIMVINALNPFNSVRAVPMTSAHVFR